MFLIAKKIMYAKSTNFLSIATKTATTILNTEKGYAFNIDLSVIKKIKP